MNALKKLMSHGPMLKARCKLCQQQGAKRGIEHPPLNIPVIGEPGKETQDLLKAALQHLGKHHAEELGQGIQLQNEFQVFRILSAFEYEDPSIVPRLEMIRAAVFAIVRRNSISDASLQHVVATWGLDPDDADKVFAGMKAVRDACCELGEHAPKVPEESRILQV